MVIPEEARSGPPLRLSAMSEEPWTTRRLRAFVMDFLKRHGVESHQFCTDLLMAHALGVPRLALYTDADRPATDSELKTLRELVARAAKHEPVQYLVGRWGFFGHELEVNSSTLIPRPATEALVAEAIRLFAEDRRLRLLDIGTGTGCIAIAILRARRDAARGRQSLAWSGAPSAAPPESSPATAPGTCAVATDISAAALELAQRNAHAAGLAEAIDFRCGDLFAPREARCDEPFDLICANPPYIGDSAFAQLQPNVREWEPASALRGGPDGLRVVEPLIRQAPRWLKPGGWLLVEIGFDQRDSVLEIASTTPGLSECDVLRDDEGHWRVLRSRCVAQAGAAGDSALRTSSSSAVA